VVDASSADPEGQINAVRTVLTEIGAETVPELIVFNKVDRVKHIDDLLGGHPGSVGISALTGDGVSDMLRTLGDRLRALANVVELFVPYDKGEVLAAIHREGEVLSESHEDGGIRFRARLDDASAGKLAAYVMA
jgi:GTP-binding protein HflX